jgi:hypothetical protein
MDTPARSGIDALLNRQVPDRPGTLPGPYSPGSSPGPVHLASAASAAGGVAVDRAALPAEARVWDQQGDTMGTITIEIASASVTTQDTGVFSGVVAAYNSAAIQIGSWCAEGQQTMASIAAALRRAAQTYDDTETQNTSDIAGIYRNITTT